MPNCVDMSFDDFIELMDSLILPYGAQMLPEELAPDKRVWKAPSGETAAIVTYQPEDVRYPVRLALRGRHQDGAREAAGGGAPRAPLLFKLDDYGARSAAITTLDYFGIDNDLNVTDDDTG